MKKGLAIACLALLAFSMFSGMRTSDATVNPLGSSTGLPSSSHKDLYGVIDEILSWYFVNLNIEDLSIHGNPKLVPGIVGNSVTLNGMTDYIEVQGTKETDTISYVELSAWVKPNYADAPQKMAIMTKDKAFSLSLKKYGLGYHLEFAVFNGISWTFLYSDSPIGEKWTNVSVVYDGTSMSILINGQLDAQKSMSNNPLYYYDRVPVRNPVTLNSDAPIIIGASNSNLGTRELFKGTLDEVQFYFSPSRVFQEKAGPANVTINATNQTGLRLGNITNVTMPGLSLNGFSNATISQIPAGNATGVPSGAVQENFTRTISNATSTANETVAINDTVSATTVPAPNSTLALPEALPFGDTVTTNVTSQGLGPVSSVPLPQAPIPNATELYQFNSTAVKGTAVGKAEVRTVQNRTGLSLTGEGYVHENGTSTGQISNFTVSAWVKPDYSRGSSQFTVVGKERSFILSVNNAYPPAHAAKFSLFDGMRWHTVTSNVTISENWTHLAATFNGTSIAIYVNGTRQNSQDIGLVPTFNMVGQPELVRAGNITSSADVVIGAYQALRGNVAQVDNLFSGEISTVSLYTRLLNQSEIQQLYSSNLPVASPVGQPVTVPTAAMENFTAVPVTPQVTDTKASYGMTERPEFSFEFFSDSNLQKLGKSTKESHGTVQTNGWKDANATISIKVTDPSGKQVPLESKFMKLRAGKFDIQLDSLRSGRAGLYKVALALMKDGKTYSSEQQFSWGLVSVNTQKSIYRPGEIANFTIVVLDDQGHSVCDSNIALRILDPQGHGTTLTTRNGIFSDPSCGLYYANYTTSGQGNYTVSASAKTPSGIATFGTSFLVSNNFDFEIARTADSKIDPINNPNLFGVRIDLTSHTSASSVTVRESVPSEFNVTTDAAVQTVGDTKVLTWNRNLADNNTSVSYAYSVPLVFPKLYALGPVTVTYGDKNFTEARQWFVANDPPGGITLAPTSGTVDTKVAVSATGWSNGDTVTISFDGVAMTTSPSPCVVLSSKAFNCSFYVPFAAAGSHTVQAASSHATKTATFTVTSEIALSPSSGFVGSSVSVNGTGMKASSTTTVKYDNVAQTTTPGTCSTDSKGSFLCSFTVPTSTTGAHTVLATDGTNNPTATYSAYNQYTNSPSETLNLSDGTVLATKVVAKSLSESLALGDALSPKLSKTKLLTESVGLTGDVSAARSSAHPSESLSVTDAVTTFHGNVKSLAESIPMGDAMSKALAKTASLGESLSINGDITTKHGTLKSIAESLSINDILSTRISISKPLTESLALTDSISKTASSHQSLVEFLAVSDSIAKTSAVSQQLAESLAVGDANSRTREGLVQLADSLDLIDATSRTQTSLVQLAESLATNDANSRTQSTTVQLAESLAASDTVTNTAAMTKTIDDSMQLGDTMARTMVLTKPLSESIVVGDSASTSHGNVVLLGEGLEFNDNMSRSFTVIKEIGEQLQANDAVTTAHANLKILSEQLAAGDALTNAVSLTHLLAESLPVGDSMTSTVDLNLPLAESMPLSDSASVLHDNLELLGDHLAINDTATRSFTIVHALDESLQLGDGTAVSHQALRQVGESLAIGDTAARSVAVTRQLAESVQLGDGISSSADLARQLAESLALGDAAASSHENFNQVGESLGVADTVSSIRSTTKSLAESLALSGSTTELHDSVKPLAESLPLNDTSSGSASLVKQFGESLAVNDSSATLAQHTQSIGQSLALTDSVEPSKTRISDLSESVSVGDSVTATLGLKPDQQKVNPTDTQITVSPATPKLVVADQNIQLSSIVIPSTVTSSSIDYSRVMANGTVQISHALNITKDTNADNRPEVVVTIPQAAVSGNQWDGIITLPTPQSAALIIPAPADQAVTQDINVKIGSSTELKLGNAARILFVGEKGHHVGYYNTIDNVNEITKACTGDTQSAGNSLPADGSCKVETGNDVAVWTKHFTGFVTWHYVTVQTTLPTHGSGATGISLSGPAISASMPSMPGVAGVLAPSLAVYQVSYDVCQGGDADVLLGTTEGAIVRMNVLSGSSIVQGRPAAVQPFAEYENLTGGPILEYHAKLDPRATSFTITAISQVPEQVVYAQKVVAVTGCHDTVFFRELPPLPVPQAPAIFGVHAAVGNGTLMPAEVSQYVNGTALSVQALIVSNATVHDAQIRLVNASQDSGAFGSVNMTITPVGNSSYLVNGTVPPGKLSAPFSEFWVWARGGDGLVSQSSQYPVGVTPSYPLNVTLSLESKPVAVEGREILPIVYVSNNSTGPIFGSVSLVANGTVTSQSPAILFGTGVSAVQMGWVPTAQYQNSLYNLSARAEFYGTTLDTGDIGLETIPAYRTVTLSDLGVLGPLTNQTGVAIGEPVGLYSSFANSGGYAYRVSSPDGTCIIGQGQDCLVRGPALGDTAAHVTVSGHHYTVEYTGPAAKVQRFTIQSSEPMSGKWNAEIERSGAVQQDMDARVIVKITYSEAKLTSIIASSR